MHRKAFNSISHLRCKSTQAVTKTHDPFSLLAPQLSDLKSSLLSLLGSSHPAVTEITKYYFLQPSKRIRPLIVLLLAQATNGLGGDWSNRLQQSGAHERFEDLDRPLTRPDVLNDWNPCMPTLTSRFDPLVCLQPRERQSPQQSFPAQVPLEPTKSHPHHSAPALSHTILPTQQRLAQIVEMVHTATLLHDDVVDESALRRRAPSAPAVFGNKSSVLGGTFVVGRMQAALARLGDPEVTELILSVLSNLVEGELLQLKVVELDSTNENDQRAERTTKLSTEGRHRHAWNVYLQKTYLKTASLIAKGARAAVVLGGCREGEIWKEIAYAYGRNIGIAFQLMDDVLDYEAASVTLGKPGGADLQLGLATGPALYAWEEHSEIRELIQRKFKNPGDVELAKDYIFRSSGIQRTRTLAQTYADKAKEVLQRLPESEAKACLEILTERIMTRKS